MKNNLSIVSIFFIILSTLVVTSYKISFKLSKTVFYSSFRDNNYMTPFTRDKLAKGLLSPREIDRIFQPSNAEVESFMKISSKGFAGVILSLDTSLVDLKQLFGYSFALLAGEVQQSIPNPKTVYDTIGSSFKTCSIAYGWDLESKNMNLYEDKWHQILEKLLDILPIAAVEGATRVINDIIDGGNQISVVSCLPRSLALKVLRKSQLSSVFEGRVPPDNLICRDELPAGVSVDIAPGGSLPADESFSSQRLARSLGAMRSPTSLTVCVDGNRRDILAAKRAGLSVIAIQGILNSLLRQNNCCNVYFSCSHCLNIAIHI